MRPLRRLLVASLLATGCSTVATELVYAEPGYDFGRLATFTVDSLPSSDATAQASESAAAAATRVLEDKGFRAVAEDPDFVVVLRPQSQAELSGWMVQRRKASVELTGEVVDTARNRVVWRAKAVVDREPHMLPADVQRKIDQVVAALLRRFPP